MEIYSKVCMHASSNEKSSVRDTFIYLLHFVFLAWLEGLLVTLSSLLYLASLLVILYSKERRSFYAHLVPCLSEHANGSRQAIKQNPHRNGFSSPLRLSRLLSFQGVRFRSLHLFLVGSTGGEGNREEKNAGPSTHGPYLVRTPSS